MTCWKVPRPRVLVAMGPTKDLNPPLDKGTGRDPFGRPYIIHVCTRSVFFSSIFKGLTKKYVKSFLAVRAQSLTPTANH